MPGERSDRDGRGIGFNRHRKDPCEALKKELQNLEDQYHRALANADVVQSDPLGNAIAGGIGAGLASAAADLATLAGDGIESFLGDEGAGIAEGTPGEGGTEQPPGGEKEPPPSESRHSPETLPVDLYIRCFGKTQLDAGSN